MKEKMKEVSLKMKRYINIRAVNCVLAVGFLFHCKGSCSEPEAPRLCKPEAEQMSSTEEISQPLEKISQPLVIDDDNTELVTASLQNDRYVLGVEYIAKIGIVKKEKPITSSSMTMEGSCTGFMISNNYMLTAAHCFEEEVYRGISYAPVVLDNAPPGLTSCGSVSCVTFSRLKTGNFTPLTTPPIYQFKIEKIVKNGFTETPSLDYLFLKIKPDSSGPDDRPAGKVWGHFTRFNRPGNFKVPNRIYRAGFGAINDKDKNGDYMHIDRSGNCTLTSGCVKDLGEYSYRIKYLCDTAKGDSGGPIVNYEYEDGTVIGVNRGSRHGYRENFYIDYGNSRFEYEFNDGISMAQIMRDTDKDSDGELEDDLNRL